MNVSYNRRPRNPYRDTRDRLGCGAVVGLVFIAIVLIFAISLLNAWILMVLWGAILPKFGVQTIGYGTAYLICLGLAFLGSFFKSATSSR